MIAETLVDLFKDPNHWIFEITLEVLSGAAVWLWARAGLKRWVHRHDVEHHGTPCDEHYHPGINYDVWPDPEWWAEGPYKAPAWYGWSEAALLCGDRDRNHCTVVVSDKGVTYLTRDIDFLPSDHPIVQQELEFQEMLARHNG